MDTLKCIETRRSIRKFMDKEVSKETVTKLVEYAKCSPSWKNVQPARYTAIYNRDVINKITEKNMPSFNTAILKNAPVTIALSALKKRSAYERDGSFSTVYEDGYTFFDTGIAAQTLCLAAHDMGLGTVIIGVFDVAESEKIIGIPESEELLALIALGYPDGEGNATKRKETEVILKFME